MVYLFLAEGFEEIEALCPCDLLRRTGIEVQTLSVTENRMVSGSHGIRVEADRVSSDTLEDFDMLILPGGMPGTKHLDASALVDSMLSRAAAEKKYIAAICAAPMVLGRRGLLSGREAICFPGFEGELTGARLSDKKVCRDGNIITAAGMGVSHAFGLALVEVFRGREAAEALGNSVLLS